MQESLLVCEGRLKLHCALSLWQWLRWGEWIKIEQRKVMLYGIYNLQWKWYCTGVIASIGSYSGRFKYQGRWNIFNFFVHISLGQLFIMAWDILSKYIMRKDTFYITSCSISKGKWSFSAKWKLHCILQNWKQLSHVPISNIWTNNDYKTKNKQF